MEINIVFNIENSKGDKISLTEDEAQSFYKEFRNYFEEKQQLFDKMRDPITTPYFPFPNPTMPLFPPLDPSIPDPYRMWYSDGTDTILPGSDT